MLTPERIRELVRVIASGSTDQDTAWEELRPLGPDAVPLFAEAFAGARRWQGRVALVYHCIRFARVVPAAFDLGLVALRDKSYMVRYRACGLLAYSLKVEALPVLRTLLN